MKTYKCDACGEMIDNPYKERVKEFLVESEICESCILPLLVKRKKKIHLCGECFEGLSFIKKGLDERERSESDG